MVPRCATKVGEENRPSIFGMYANIGDFESSTVFSSAPLEVPVASGSHQVPQLVQPRWTVTVLSLFPLFT
jgi:hypothetical protein